MIHQPIAEQDYAATNPFYSYPIEKPIPIIKGIIQERQIGFLAGYWALGKTPLYIEMALSVVSGQPFIGELETTKRPVIVLDAETNFGDYQPSSTRIARRLNVSPEDMKNFIPILRYGSQYDPLSQNFQSCLGDEGRMLDLISTQLDRHPNALVILDPLLEIFPLADTNKDGPVLDLYNKFRDRLCKYPHAAFNVSLHLRKSRGNERTVEGGFATAEMLLNHPRQALQEVAGSNKFGAHADSRFMLAPSDDNEDELLLKGLIRGKDGAEIGMKKSMLEPEVYNGFEPCPQLIEGMKAPLKSTDENALKKLPKQFRFEDLVKSDTNPHGIPKSTLSGYLNRGKRHGVRKDKATGLWLNPFGRA